MRLMTKFLATAALVAPAAAFASTTWTFANGYPEDSYFTKNLRQFAEEIEKETKGELKFDIRTNGTLIKHDAIKRAVQSGQIPIGEVRLGVYGNEGAIYNLDSIPNVAANLDQAWKLMEASKPYFDKVFADNGMRIVTYVAWPGQGFYTKTEVNTPADFKGKKLRIYSQPTQRMGDLLGFEAIILPFAEVPQAFATGMIDAMYTSAQTGIDTQAWDNTKYYMYTGTQHTKNAIMINERAFRRLSPEVQKIVLAAGERATKRGFEMAKAAEGETLDTLRKNGMNVKMGTPEVQAALDKAGVVLMEEWRATANPEELAVLDTYLKSIGKK